MSKTILITGATDASGRYYDNDNRRFADPQTDALDTSKNERIVSAMEEIIAERMGIKG